MTSDRSPGGLAHDGVNVVKGVLMGGADVVPGVSGGTVALIVGIYERLITAISHVDVELFGLVRSGRWADATGDGVFRTLVQRRDRGMFEFDLNVQTP